MKQTNENVKQENQDSHSFFYTFFSIRKNIPAKEKEKIRLLIHRNFECIQALIPMARFKTESVRNFNTRIKEYKNISRNLTLNIWAAKTSGKMLNLPMDNNFLSSSSFAHHRKHYKEIIDAYIKADIIKLEKKGFRFVTPTGVVSKTGGYLPSSTFFTNMTNLWRDEMTMPNYARYVLMPSYPKNWEPVIIVNKKGEKIYRSKKSLRAGINRQRKRECHAKAQWAFDFDKIEPTYDVIPEWNKIMQNTIVSFEIREDVLRKLTYDQVETLASLYAQGKIISFSELPYWVLKKYEKIHKGLFLKKLKLRDEIKSSLKKNRRKAAQSYKRPQQSSRRTHQSSNQTQPNAIKDNQPNPHIPHITYQTGYSTGTDVPVEPPLGTPSTPISQDYPARPLCRRSVDYLSEIVEFFPKNAGKQVDSHAENIRNKMLANVCNLWKKRHPHDSMFYVVPTRLVRIFNETVESGGRFYRSTIQSLPAEVRLRLKFNGRSVRECDFTAIHPNILYSMIGAEPVDNPYVFGKDRPQLRREAKLALLILINSTSMENAVQALRYSFVKDLGYKKGNLHLRDNYIHKLFDILSDHNYKINRFFCTGAGIKLMRVDSDIALHILKHFVKQGTLVVPIHDSFIICDKFHTEETVQVMKEAFKKVAYTNWEIPVSVNTLE